MFCLEGEIRVGIKYVLEYERLLAGPFFDSGDTQREMAIDVIEKQKNMAGLSRSQIGCCWKKELQELGFHFQRGIFERGTGAIRQEIGIQKNSWEPTFKIHVDISVFDPFLLKPGSHACLHAHVRRDGVYSNEADGSWWPEGEILGAVASVIKYGIPWLTKHGEPEILTNLLEKGLSERRMVESLLEPLSEPPPYFASLYPEAPSHARRFPPAIYYYHLSLLYCARNDFENGCRHAMAWLEHASRGTAPPHEPERTHRILEYMRCKGSVERANPWP